MSRAGLDKNPREVAEMFDGVAKGYDLTNSVMTLGFDRRWREWTRRALDARAGEKILDLAAGTAVSTVEFASSGAWCVAADFSLGMLRSGARRPVPKIAADALHLPFADGVFDAATVSFGLRNFQGTVAALREMARVVRPGGRLVICELSKPSWKPCGRSTTTSPSRPCRSSPDPSPPTPTPTPTSPSPSATGTTSAPSPSSSPRPAGRTSPG